MSDIRPTRTPQESADNLADALNAQTEALNKVRRRYFWALLSIAVLALSFAITLKFNYDGNVNRCELGNDLRTELNVRHDGLASILISAGVGDSPEGQAIIDIYEEDFPIRDCGDINWLGH